MGNDYKEVKDFVKKLLVKELWVRLIVGEVLWMWFLIVNVYVCRFIVFVFGLLAFCSICMGERL